MMTRSVLDAVVAANAVRPPGRPCGRRGPRRAEPLRLGRKRERCGSRESLHARAREGERQQQPWSLARAEPRAASKRRRDCFPWAPSTLVDRAAGSLTAQASLSIDSWSPWLSLSLSESRRAPRGSDSSRCEGANGRFRHPFLIVYQPDCRLRLHVAEEPLRGGPGRKTIIPSMNERRLSSKVPSLRLRRVARVKLVSFAR